MEKLLHLSKRHNTVPFYNELYKNGSRYEIKSICYVYYNDKSEIFAKELNKIKI